MRVGGGADIAMASTAFGGKGTVSSPLPPSFR